MDGSAVVIPSAKPPAGLAREDALFRIVYYGEALRAMTEHVSDSLISGQCAPMIEMLDEAFDTLSDKRDSFGPEEFTLFVMSKMLGMCDDADEARQFQVGAAQYILKSADALPDTYKPVVEDAQQMLRRSALAHVDKEVVPEAPQTPEARTPEPQTAVPRAPEAETPAPVVPALAAPAVAAPPASRAAAIAAPRAPHAPRATTASRTVAPMASLATVTRSARSPGRRPAHRGGRGFYTFLERSILAGFVVFVMGVMVMFVFGYVDTDGLTPPGSTAAAPSPP
jgi:hypothetical protein